MRLKPRLLFVPLLLLSVPSARAGEKIAPATVGEEELEIKKGDIEVFTKVTGIATAQDTYEVYAAFDGRVEDVQAELFDFVGPETVLARLVSTEMAALLDSSSEENKKQTEKRWQGVYDYYPVKPAFQGIVTAVHAEPRTRVYKGDRLFTVAKKVVVVGKNTEKLYSKLAPGMSAELSYSRDAGIRLKTTLKDFLRLKDSPYFNRLWLEVSELRSGIRIGGQFDGFLFVGRSENTLLVPRTGLIERGGRKYLIMEVETGLVTEAETEILRPGLRYLEPKYPPAAKAAAGAKDPAKAPEGTDGKTKKAD